MAEINVGSYLLSKIIINERKTHKLSSTKRKEEKITFRKLNEDT